MDIYPRLGSETIEDVVLVIRRIIDLRDDDIAESDANKQLNGYESGFARQTVSTSAAYSVGVNDLAVDATGGAGGITLTLSATPLDGQTHEFFKADAAAGAITIDGNGKNINGSANFTIGSQYGWARVIYIGGAGEWRKQT